MNFEEWLASVQSRLVEIKTQEQLQHFLELAFKTGYKAALDYQLSADPVAWEHVITDGLSVYYPHREYLDPMVKNLLPLYRYPPARQPLSDKTIDMLTDRYWGRSTVRPQYNTYRQYVHAVEKLHGIQ